MKTKFLDRIRKMAALMLAGAGLTLWPAAALAQSVSGDASALRATVLGSSTILAATGPLQGPDDLREASGLAADVPFLVQGDALHAATGSSVDGWGAGDYVASEASIADLGLTAAGTTISAAFVMARAMAPVSGAATGTSEIDGLSINGVPVVVTGAVNQTINLLGGRVVLNEQVPGSTGTVVNAIHLVVNGIADVVVASAAAGIDSGGSTPPPLPLPLGPLGR
jgi:hypothetical protein